jgi:hypothetical protein
VDRTCSRKKERKNIYSHTQIVSINNRSWVAHVDEEYDDEDEDSCELLLAEMMKDFLFANDHYIALKPVHRIKQLL